MKIGKKNSIALIINNSNSNDYFVREVAISKYVVPIYECTTTTDTDDHNYTVLELTFLKETLFQLNCMRLWLLLYANLVNKIVDRSRLSPSFKNEFQKCLIKISDYGVACSLLRIDSALITKMILQNRLLCSKFKINVSPVNPVIGGNNNNRMTIHDGTKDDSNEASAGMLRLLRKINSINLKLYLEALRFMTRELLWSTVNIINPELEITIHFRVFICVRKVRVVNNDWRMFLDINNDAASFPVFVVAGGCSLKSVAFP